MRTFKIGERVRYRDCPEPEGTIVPTGSYSPFFGIEGNYNVDWDVPYPTSVKHWSILVAVDYYDDFLERIQDRLG